MAVARALCEIGEQTFLKGLSLVEGKAGISFLM
jgi:hypothetical protein